MLKRYTYKLLAAAALLIGIGLVGCDSSELPDREPVQLDITINGEKDTHARASIDGKTFTAGDEFQFFFDAATPVSTHPGEKKAVYTYASGAWGTTTPIYWDEYKAEERYFCAFLPYDGANEDKAAYSFSVTSDQADEARYRASDLLIARVKTAKRLIPIRFWHVLSKVTVNVTASTDATNPDKCFGAGDLTGMKVELLGLNQEATINYKELATDVASYDPALETTAKDGGTSANITMLCTEAPAHNATEKKITASYTAIVPPQSIADGIRSITLTLMDGVDPAKTYHLKHKDAIIFDQGKQTIIKISLYKNEVEITTTAGDIKVAPWGTITADGGTIVLPKEQTEP